MCTPERDVQFLGVFLIDTAEFLLNSIFQKLVLLKLKKLRRISGKIFYSVILPFILFPATYFLSRNFLNSTLVDALQRDSFTYFHVNLLFSGKIK